MSKVDIKETRVLSNGKYQLKEVTYEIDNGSGKGDMQKKEVYDRGDAATVLLYNKDEKKVLLTRQFRLPTYLNKNKDGFLIEACAGLLEEGEGPDETIKREIAEETGYHLTEIVKAFEAYSSPGALTELLYCYIAHFKEEDKKEKGGGLEEEHEHIELVGLPIDEALEGIETGLIKDAKTIMLLQYLRIKDII